MIINPQVPLHRLILSLSQVLDYVHPSVIDHQQRVAYIVISIARQLGLDRGKLLVPARRRKVVQQVRRELGASQRRACKVLGQARSTQRYKPKLPEKDKPVIDDLLVLHVKHPRYGCHQKVST